MQSEIGEPTAAKHANDRRTDDRAKVGIPCEVRIGAKSWRKATVGDLTPEGCRIDLTDSPIEGTPVYLRFAGLQMLHGEVRWARYGTLGCQFDSPISSYVFDHIVSTA